jgi:hypothetical protein
MQPIRVVNEKEALFVTHADGEAAIRPAEGIGYCIVRANAVKEIHPIACKRSLKITHLFGALGECLRHLV